MNKITIITVCFNSQQTILKTLESISVQSYKNFEHIVIDGNSTDNTLKIIKNYKGHEIFLLSEPDQGAYDAMNKGLKRARGDIIAFLNSDDVYASTDVLACINDLFVTKSCDLIYGDLTYTKQDDLSKPVRFWKSCPYKNGLFERGWMPPHPTVFARRSVYEKYGNFSMKFKFQADFDLLCRFLAKYQVSSFYLEKNLVKMHLGGMTNRSIKNIIIGNLEARRACIDNSLTPKHFFILRKILSKIPQFIRSK